MQALVPEGRGLKQYGFIIIRTQRQGQARVYLEPDAFHLIVEVTCSPSHKLAAGVQVLCVDRQKFSQKEAVSPYISFYPAERFVHHPPADLPLGSLVSIASRVLVQKSLENCLCGAFCVVGTRHCQPGRRSAG